MSYQSSLNIFEILALLSYYLSFIPGALCLQFSVSAPLAVWKTPTHSSRPSTNVYFSHGSFFHSIYYESGTLLGVGCGAWNTTVPPLKELTGG